MELFLIYLWLQINTISALITLIGAGMGLYVVGMLIHYGATYKQVNPLSKEQLEGLVKDINAKDSRYFSVHDFKVAGEYLSTENVSTFSVVKKWMYLGIFCVATGFLMPSKTDIAILVGASIAMDLAKSPEAEKVSILLRGKANELLDAEIKKLQPNK